MQKLLILIFGLLISLTAFSQTYQFVVDSFPTISKIDTIDEDYILSIDTSKLIDLFRSGVGEKDSQGNWIRKDTTQKNHILGKFYFRDLCWALYVTDFLNNGSNGSRVINLTLFNKDGKTVGGPPLARYIGLRHMGAHINECYFTENGFRIVPTTSLGSVLENPSKKEEYVVKNDKLMKIK